MLRKAKDLRSQKKVAKVVDDKLIVHEKEKENEISEAQGDPLISLKLKENDCGYIRTNVNKRLKFKIQNKKQKKLSKINPSKDFEQINFNPFNFFNDQDQDPDLNYFNDLNSNNFDSLYVLEENVKRYLCDIKKYDSISLIHFNIRSMNSNFEKLHDLLLNCSSSFNIICVTETWSTDKDFKNNSSFHLPHFDFIYQE